ncbi:MAG: hypothetical protein M3Y91_01555 [Actinomycetota bacterium]|nr:hypothetical protein [Actinomycetota bacterium]
MSGPDDPLGRRSLFSASDESAAVTGESARVGESGGRRALFSTPQTRGRSVVVVCRTCRARTPLSFADMVRRLVASAWLPVLSRWTRWMRCPSCGTFSWCRVEWSHLISGR